MSEWPGAQFKPILLGKGSLYLNLISYEHFPSFKRKNQEWQRKERMSCFWEAE